MTTVAVTGGSGLVGSNVCADLVEHGYRVRAVVRTLEAAAPLRKLGVEPVIGDITDAEGLRRAARGCEAIIHAAALVGGLSQDPVELHSVNVQGTVNVLDVAAARTVVISSINVFGFSTTITESSPVGTGFPDDPYTRSKRAAHAETMRRAEQGQDALLVAPAAVFGPAPIADRAMLPVSWNRTIAATLRGRVSAFPHFEATWVLAGDVARAAVLALERGASGGCYLAFGRVQDVTSPARFLNHACELAGVEHRVQEVQLDEASPGLVETLGASVVELARARLPDPLFDAALTETAIGYRATPLDTALLQTVDWLGTLERSPRR